MKLKNLILIFFLCLLFRAYSVENENKAKKVCIIYFESKYKLELLTRLEKNLNELNIEYTKDILKNVNNYDPDNFDAVIILSGIAAFIPYPQATMYIKKHNYKDNIIYFCSAYTEDAIYGFMDSTKLDAITSASKMENVDSTANEIITRLLEIIHNRK